MTPARKLSLVRKPRWSDTHGIASHADHLPAVFAREMNRRDGSHLEPSPPVYGIRAFVRDSIEQIRHKVVRNG